MNCRGQSYDNPAAMARRWTDVEQRMKYINPNAKFVPCLNHSLNLDCLQAASVEVNSMTFFGTLEHYNALFCMSTLGLEVLIAIIGKGLKRIQDSRWNARGDAVNTTRNYYKFFLTMLEKLTEKYKSLYTQTEAGT
ncbi:hypothetical protein NPIL_9011 [Nephila pilipes]|uniref:Uncharacterized protein n=1 Tax=Nephila pilipes TaxID=299642 RepID=A0A8X6TH59_NEPPI|nr:hypothetical protein NPIL_9011 [Nephila pilipes]